MNNCSALCLNNNSNNMDYINFYNIQEMLISPSLLDFLEQAIEPIPMSRDSNTKANKNTGKLLFLRWAHMMIFKLSFYFNVIFHKTSSDSSLLYTSWQTFKGYKRKHI